MDAQTRAWLDQEDARMKTIIRRHGVCIRAVGGGPCAVPGCGCGEEDLPFAYTIGLFGIGHPELLIVGLDPEHGAAVLNAIARRVRTGRDLVPDRMVSLEIPPHHIIPEVVPNPGAIVFDANRFYDRSPDHPVSVLQLSYCDGGERFPWEDGYDGPVQPRPGTFAA